MTVEAVVSDVKLTVIEPLCYWSIAPVEHASEGLVPVKEFLCLLIPEAEAVLLGICIQVGLANRLCCEFSAWWKATLFVHQVVNIVAHVEHLTSLGGD